MNFHFSLPLLNFRPKPKIRVGLPQHLMNPISFQVLGPVALHILTLEAKNLWKY